MAKQPRAATAQAALERALRGWGEYPVTEVRFARCTCGADVFAVQADDACGALRICHACRQAHHVCDSAEYWDEAEPDECACPCGNETFQLAAGFAFFQASQDVRWIYVALRCTACGEIGIYVDWKIDYSPSAQLLDRV